MLVADNPCCLALWRIARLVCSLDVFSPLSLFSLRFFIRRLVAGGDDGCLGWRIDRWPGSFPIFYFVSSYLLRTTLTSRHWIVGFSLKYVWSSFSFLYTCSSELFLSSLPSHMLATSSAHIICVDSRIRKTSLNFIGPVTAKIRNDMTENPAASPALAFGIG